MTADGRPRRVLHSAPYYPHMNSLIPLLLDDRSVIDDAVRRARVDLRWLANRAQWLNLDPVKEVKPFTDLIDQLTLDVMPRARPFEVGVGFFCVREIR
jgi:hypothetical protein